MKIKSFFGYVINGFRSMVRFGRVKPVLNQGPRDQNSPPDLDQVLADLKSKFFGGGEAKPPSTKELGVGVFAVFMIVFLLWCSSGFFIVQEGYSAVLTQFGKYHSTVGAGFHWRIPYPVQAHETVNISQVRKVEVGFRGDSKNKQPTEALILTDDENIVDLQFVVQYRLKEDGAKDFLFNNRPLEGEDFGSDVLVRQIAEAAVREVVGKQNMDFVLYEGREQVAGETEKLTQQILDRYQSGVLIMNVSIQNAQPPEQVQSAFDDAVRAGQDRERQINEGQAYANDIIPRASGAAARLIEEANAHKVRVVEMALGDAERFKRVLAEYSNAPQVTRQRMYIETMQNVFTNTSKVLLDNKSAGGGQLLYLPLDRLMSAVKEGDSPTQAVELKPEPSSSLNETRQKDVGAPSSFGRDRTRDH